MQSDYKNIYTGKFTNVYIDKKENVIVKQYTNIILYKNEREIYKKLFGLNYVANIYNYFKKDKVYNIIIENIGIDLVRFKKKYYHIDKYNVYIKYFILQLISIIKNIHEINIIHRDLKPKNICTKNGKIYLIDFEYSCKYKYKNKHIENTKISSIIGSYDYISEHVLNLNTPSRRDDVESIIYILIYLLLSKMNYKKYNELDYNIKKKQKIIGKILSYYFKNTDDLNKMIYEIKSLGYDATPNYNNFKIYIYNNLNLKIN